MSHDRGCFQCGRDHYEYFTCDEVDCVKRSITKPKQPVQLSNSMKIDFDEAVVSKVEHVEPFEIECDPKSDLVTLVRLGRRQDGISSNHPQGSKFVISKKQLRQVLKLIDEQEINRVI
jgi:hypothetical protein